MIASSYEFLVDILSTFFTIF